MNKENLMFSQTAQKFSPYYSKICNNTLEKHIDIPGNHLKIVKFPLQKPSSISPNLRDDNIKIGHPYFQLLPK